MTDKKLSKHFKLRELIESSTAEKHHIPNIPDELRINKLKDLCENVLEVIREHYGKPIVISSGYRCEELNKLVKGAKNSQHVKGEACDFKIDGLTPYTVCKAIVALRDQGKIEFDQVILEPSWVHISYVHGNNRNDV